MATLDDIEALIASDLGPKRKSASAKARRAR
jgi:hypothetical protein